jgi:hypothetical protein
MLFSGDDGHHFVPATARTVRRADSMFAAVWFRNQPNGPVVGNPDTAVWFRIRVGVYIRGHAHE